MGVDVATLDGPIKMRSVSIKVEVVNINNWLEVSTLDYLSPRPINLRYPLLAAYLQVLKQFRLIAATSGSKSVDKKKALITKLLAASKAQEAGYIMRALQVRLEAHRLPPLSIGCPLHPSCRHRVGVRRCQTFLSLQTPCSYGQYLPYNEC